MTKRAKRATRYFGYVPGTSVSLLSSPSKMPGYSWSLPAHRSCSRENGDICKDCYASKGFYAFYPAVLNAQNVRFDWTRESLKSSDGRKQWINTLYNAIYRTRTKYFRVHDSGDMFNASYAAMWAQVMARLEKVRFWVPTHAWQIPWKGMNAFTILDQSSDALLRELTTMAELPNVTVRPSALNFGEVPPSVKGLHAGTSADCESIRQCPAHSQGNQCRSCRECWDNKSTMISYHRH